MSSLATHTELSRLLQIRNDYPDRVAEIDQQIYATFEQECAIFVLDMAGFSCLTLKHGIIHFLAMVNRMVAIATPILTQHGGAIVKQEADNIFAIFPDVQEAVQASIALFKAVAASNEILPDEHDLYASIGIGYGKTLVISNPPQETTLARNVTDICDLFGGEMNLACKLGEDLARRGEILITESAYNRLPANPKVWERLVLSVSRIELVTYKLRNSPIL